MAAPEPSDGEPTTPDRTMHADGLLGISSARRVVAARRRQQRRDEPAIPPDGNEQQPGRDPLQRRGHAWSTSSRGSLLVRAVDRSASARHARSRSAASSAEVRVAELGRARTTIKCPVSHRAAEWVSCWASTARSRRDTRCRTTALPTPLLTIRPTRVAWSWGPGAAWMTTLGWLARRPRRRAWVNSRLCRIRCAAGSTDNSGSELGAALAAPRGNDRSTGPRPHAEPETVGLGPTTVVGLEGTFGHQNSVRAGRETRPWEGLKSSKQAGKRVGDHRTPAPNWRRHAAAAEECGPLRYNAPPPSGQTAWSLGCPIAGGVCNRPSFHPSQPGAGRHAGALMSTVSEAVVDNRWTGPGGHR